MEEKQESAGKQQHYDEQFKIKCEKLKIKCKMKNWKKEE